MCDVKKVCVCVCVLCRLLIQTQRELKTLARLICQLKSGERSLQARWNSVKESLSELVTELLCVSPVSQKDISYTSPDIVNSVACVCVCV